MCFTCLFLYEEICVCPILESIIMLLKKKNIVEYKTGRAFLKDISVMRINYKKNVFIRCRRICSIFFSLQ